MLEGDSGSETNPIDGAEELYVHDAIAEIRLPGSGKTKFTFSEDGWLRFMYRGPIIWRMFKGFTKVTIAVEVGRGRS